MRENNLALSFADDTELYDLVRPGYSSRVIQCLLETTKVLADKSILEIGPGSGKLTEHLVNTGLHVSCVEPAAAFFDFLKGRFEGYENLSVVSDKFEDFEERTEQKYDLVASAQAFHWIGWKVGLPKIKNLLAPNGYLALIWYSSHLADTKLSRELDLVYSKYPEVTARLPGSFPEKWEDPQQKLKESGFFSNLDLAEFTERHRYTSLVYKFLASTQSQYKKLEPERREELLQESVAVIQSFGGFIDVDYRYFLHTAQLTKT